MYFYVIKFQLPEDEAFNCDDNKFQIDNNKLLVSGEEKKSIVESKKLYLIAKGFSSREDAAKSSILMKQSMLHLALERDIGLDFGFYNDVTSGISPFESNYRDATGGIYIGREGNLIDLESSEPIISESAGIGDYTSANVKRGMIFFQNAINLADKNSLLSTNYFLALDLLNSLMHHNSYGIRFLMCMIAIEAMSSPIERNEKYVETISHLKKCIDGLTVDIEIKNEFKSMIGKFKKEGRSASCRRTIKENLGDDYSKLFDCLYEIRSKFVHEGKYELNLPNYCNLDKSQVKFDIKICYEFSYQIAKKLFRKLAI